MFAPDETLERGHGSCRDFAWLLVNVLRQVGFAARFVSGYSIQLKADEKPVEGPDGRHARRHRPARLGRGLSARRGLDRPRRHQRPDLRRGAHPARLHARSRSAAARHGLLRLEQGRRGRRGRRAVRLRRWRSSASRTAPRPTKPYSDAQWEALSPAAITSSARSRAGDVRLTMGGEPTFVAMDDPEGDEWNTDRARSHQAQVRRQAAAQAAGALRAGRPAAPRPGQVVPGRAPAALGLLLLLPQGRRARLARPRARSPTSNAEPAARDARKRDAFVRRLSRALGRRRALHRARLRRRLYYLWRERQLPVNVDPFDSKLERRSRSARASRACSSRGSKHRGLRAAAASRPGERERLRWESGPLVRARRAHVPDPGRLAHGLSPAARLSALGRARRPLAAIFERDPFGAARAQLPERASSCARTHAGAVGRRRSARRRRACSRRAASRDRASVRTALCVEPRDGMLHVFMPPGGPARGLPRARRGRRGDRGRALGQPVSARGLPSAVAIPGSSRLQVTPDPGVIEVNIHPARSWRRAGGATRRPSTRRRGRAACGAEKFMLDGRHTGTGGGNHVIARRRRRRRTARSCGGPICCAASSRYWLNHPSLSYLFTGLFVGPTTQAPRVDEARHDALYELEIAFRRSSDAGAGGAPPPWLVDRAVPPPARRRHGQHPPRRALHRQALQPRRRTGARAWSSCARSRCRRTRA